MGQVVVSQPVHPPVNAETVLSITGQYTGASPFRERALKEKQGREGREIKQDSQNFKK